MSRRAPSTGPAQRAPSRSASIAPGRLSRATSARNDDPITSRRPTLAPSASSVRVPTEVPESSIRVAVRCRGRSRQEIADSSPVITTTDAPLAKAITVETAPGAPASAFAAAGLPSTKTYPFDKVFGPEADQTMVFREVAENMLDEVLAGYNCTIFAYGQTGTGKTFTMQGDLAPTPLLEPSNEAGIIPRVLYRLFSLLEAQENAEYAVKCSYIEIYNEELRDLLAPEYKDGTTANIKIFEDASKKGVNVQGVEESGLRNLKDGLAALNKGAQRRQTAETKMNDQSSRSHSIFTLTVHVKETSTEKGGEDLLRIGKFNLVDLAGSEAIGRSGAENKRAREAGMINQSLLTLGRVISALVDKGTTHVPYRESKLTRLLQDSLGGRTKTCIIATVSPTKSNMEETLSTLDYALRAKSIKNKPEVNAHLTKAGLLKEYVADMERLKAELYATREKNGIYVPEDQWREMNYTATKQKSDFSEARQRVTQVEVELKTRKAEFETLTSRFITTSDELASVREAERQLGHALDVAKSAADAARTELAEERVVAEAFADGEERLHSVAGELHSVARDSVHDVGGLFDKLDRVRTVLDSNTDAATDFGTAMYGLSSDLQRDIAQLHTVQSEFGSVLRQDMDAHARRDAEESQKHMDDLSSAFGAFTDLADRLSASIDGGHQETSAAAEAVLAIKNDVAATMSAWAKTTSARSTQMVDDMLQQQDEHVAVVRGVVDKNAKVLGDVFDALTDKVDELLKAFEHARRMNADASAAEVERLLAQNQLLAQLLETERAKSAQLRTDLISNVTSMINGFAEAHNTSLQSSIGWIQTQNDTTVQSVAKAAEERSNVLSSAGQVASDVLEDSINSGAADLRLMRDEHQQALGDLTSGMRTRLEKFAIKTNKNTEGHALEVDGFCDRLGTAATELSNATQRRARQQFGGVDALREDATDGYERSAKRVKLRAEEVAGLTSTLLSSHATSSQTATRAHADAEQTLTAMSNSTARFLDTLAVDTPTGTTPRKRAYEFPSAWERTEPRHVLIDSFRRGVVRGRPHSALSALSVSTTAESVEGESESSWAAGAAPRLSGASIATAFSDSTVRSPPLLPANPNDLGGAQLRTVGSAASLTSLASGGGASEYSTPREVAPVRERVQECLPPPPGPPRIGSGRDITAPTPPGAPPAATLNALRRPSRKKFESIDRAGGDVREMQAPRVLGEGGNIPRRKR